MVGAGGAAERQQTAELSAAASQAPSAGLWAAAQVIEPLVLRCFRRGPWTPPRGLGRLCPNTAAWPRP